MPSFLVSSLALSLATFASASCLYGTSLHPRNYEEGETAVHVSGYTYTGETGPLNWHALNESWTTCKTGKYQSPIDFTADQATAQELPKVNFPTIPEAEFQNLGTTIQVIASGETVFGGTTYTLKQFHVHTPSEHRIVNEHYPLEVHFVHESADKKFAVIGLLFDIDANAVNTPAFIKSVADGVASIAKPGTKTNIGPIDLSAVSSGVAAGQLLQYSGSLTTPPCSEGITFLILNKPLSIDVDSYNKIKKVVKFNSRYTQNVPGRTNLLELP